MILIYTIMKYLKKFNESKINDLKMDLDKLLNKKII